MSDIRWDRRKYTKDRFIEEFHKSSNWTELARNLGLSGSGSSVASLRSAGQSLGLDYNTSRGYSPRVKYTKELLCEAVSSSESYSGVLRFIGLKPVGGNISHIGRRIEEYGIDTSHFTGQGHNKGKRSAQPVSPSDILVLGDPLDSRVKTKKLRKCLELLGIDEVCNQCGLGTVWNGKPIVLEINHINGNYWDNRKDNLEFLCPNCHSQESESNRPHKYSDIRQEV